MYQRFIGFVVTVACLAVLANAAPAAAQDTYEVDGVHSSVSFKVSHLGLSSIHGRFNSFSGTFAINAEDAAKSTFALSIKAESIDTNNPAREEHLRSPDFFNTKQFPTISFKSTTVKAIKDGYEVTGDLTMHGVTKPVTFNLVGGKKAEFPKGKYRTGYSTELSIKRSDFGMDKMTEAIGDEVAIAISLEGVRK